MRFHRTGTTKTPSGVFFILIRQMITRGTRDAAQNATRKIPEILDLLEELPDDKNLISEISELIDEIVY